VLAELAKVMGGEECGARYLRELEVLRHPRKRLSRYSMRMSRPG
jgi:hypothetical protein